MAVSLRGGAQGWQIQDKGKEYLRLQLKLNRFDFEDDDDLSWASMLRDMFLVNKGEDVFETTPSQLSRLLEEDYILRELRPLLGPVWRGAGSGGSAVKNTLKALYTRSSSEKGNRSGVVTTRSSTYERWAEQAHAFGADAIPGMKLAKTMTPVEAMLHIMKRWGWVRYIRFQGLFHFEGRGDAGLIVQQKQLNDYRLNTADKDHSTSKDLLDELARTKDALERVPRRTQKAFALEQRRKTLEAQLAQEEAQLAKEKAQLAQDEAQLAQKKAEATLAQMKSKAEKQLDRRRQLGVEAAAERLRLKMRLEEQTARADLEAEKVQLLETLRNEEQNFAANEARRNDEQAVIVEAESLDDYVKDYRGNPAIIQSRKVFYENDEDGGFYDDASDDNDDDGDLYEDASDENDDDFDDDGYEDASDLEEDEYDDNAIFARPWQERAAALHTVDDCVAYVDDMRVLPRRSHARAAAQLALRERFTNEGGSGALKQLFGGRSRKRVPFLKGGFSLQSLQRIFSAPSTKSLLSAMIRTTGSISSIAWHLLSTPEGLVTSAALVMVAVGIFTYLPKKEAREWLKKYTEMLKRKVTSPGCYAVTDAGADFLAITNVAHAQEKDPVVSILKLISMDFARAHDKGKARNDQKENLRLMNVYETELLNVNVLIAAADAAERAARDESKYELAIKHREDLKALETERSRIEAEEAARLKNRAELYSGSRCFDESNMLDHVEPFPGDLSEECAHQYELRLFPFQDDTSRVRRKGFTGKATGQDISEPALTLAKYVHVDLCIEMLINMKFIKKTHQKSLPRSLG